VSAAEWRPVPGFEGRYEVSSGGQLRNRGTGNVFGTTSGDRYAYASFRRGKENVATSVHRLVAEVFIGPRPPGHVIDHIDGDKTNNAVANLEYVTPRENNRRAAVMAKGRNDKPDDPQGLQIRLPAALYLLIRGAAVPEGRSMNTEMVRRLWESFGRGPNGEAPKKRGTR